MGGGQAGRYGAHEGTPGFSALDAAHGTVFHLLMYTPAPRSLLPNLTNTAVVNWATDLREKSSSGVVGQDDDRAPQRRADSGRDRCVPANVPHGARNGDQCQACSAAWVLLILQSHSNPFAFNIVCVFIEFPLSNPKP